MSVGRTIRAKRLKDGTFVEVLPDGTTRPFPPDETDWAALRRMTEDEINAAALTDPDNPPRTPEREKHLKRVPQARVVRRVLHLTQEEFARRFQIPLGTLRDWEQGKTQPDQAARAYLRVIARNPAAVVEALESAPGSMPDERARLRQTVSAIQKEAAERGLTDAELDRLLADES